MEIDTVKNAEIEQEKREKPKKKSKTKEILADFLSQTILVDKKTYVFLYKKNNEQFQLLERTKPPISGSEVYNSYGDGIYRMDLRTASGTPVFPNTVFFEIRQGIARQIPTDIAEEKQGNPMPLLQGAIILTPDAVKELISSLKPSQNPLDLSSVSEIAKTLIKSQIEVVNELTKTQIQFMKEMMTQMISEQSEEEEEKEEIDIEKIASAVKEGNYELIQDVLEEVFGDNGAKFAKILKLIDGYMTAQKLKEEALKNESESGS
jgi:hypothetical protein